MTMLAPARDAIAIPIRARTPQALAEEATGLKLHRPPGDAAGGPADPLPPGATRWAITGFPATILVWSAEEYSRLPVRPADAQRAANGIWCALRMEGG